jgi:NAD(P)-dependent dehydrogenase (short-subunit alcohol dehydrogenase family)
MLDGRVVIVTGAAVGIGRAHCLELASHGAAVVANDIDYRASAVVEEISAMGGRASHDATSVTDYAGMRRVVQRVITDHGRLDAVVNNAGILRDGTLTNLTEESWDAVIAVHLKGTFALMKHACDHWRERSKQGELVSARVVNTTSGAGLWGNVGQANYSAAKAAIATLTMTAAMEMRRYGVTVNAISPIARTQMTRDLPFMRESQPIDGWDVYDPANSSPVVAWLVSEASAWLTGAILRIEGDAVTRVHPWSVDTSSRYTPRPGQRVRADEIDVGLRQALLVAPSGTPRYV